MKITRSVQQLRTLLSCVVPVRARKVQKSSYAKVYLGVLKDRDSLGDGMLMLCKFDLPVHSLLCGVNAVFRHTIKPTVKTNFILHLCDSLIFHFSFVSMISDQQ